MPFDGGGSSAFCYHVPIMDELSEHLDSLARDDCYRVDSVMKEGPFETTERVFFVGANGSEQGPYVRKHLDGEAGLGAAYERIWRAQRSGRRFLHLPLVADCHTVGERRVVVMEYVRGETLADVVYRCDPSVELACDVFPKLCDAVLELHEGFDPPLIHRDLKPSNVMLTRDNLTLIDFGIARSFDEAAEEDTHHFGTRAYAPPEQFGYGQSDVRTDVYALGMILYFCLTEKTPDAKARRAGYRAAGVPEPLRAVIERAAAFDPADRYASVRALDRAFDEAVRKMRDAEGSGLLRTAGTSVPAAAPVPEASLRTTLPPAIVREHSAWPSSAQASSSGTASARAAAANSKAVGRRGSAGASRLRRTVRSFASGLLARIPRGVGIAWDVLLALVFAVVLVGCVGTTFWPLPSSEVASHTLAYRALAYAALAFLLAGPLLYFVSDRRPLRRLLRLKRRSLGRDGAIVLSLEAAGLLVFAFLTFSGW